jgi:hypothetical protein
MSTRLITATMVLSLLAGCKTLDCKPFKLPSADAAKEKEPCVPAPQVPERVVAIWSDALYNEIGQPPIRGFGGRLYFYDGKNQAVAVSGELTVYAFDDSSEGPPPTRPSRKFAFTKEQFAGHYSATDLGPSYSLWLPWDPVGGERKAVSLMPVFTAEGGKIVTGQQSINVLPGRTPEVTPRPRTGQFTELGAPDPRNVRPAPEQQLAAAKASAEAQTPGVSPSDAAAPRDGWQQMHSYVPDAPRRGTMHATTIRLPMSTTRTLIESAAAEKNAPATGGDSNVVPATASAPEPSEPPQSSTRYVRPRYQAPRGAASAATADHAPTPPSPSAPPCSPPASLTPNPWSGPAGYSPDASAGGR